MQPGRKLPKVAELKGQTGVQEMAQAVDTIRVLDHTPVPVPMTVKNVAHTPPADAALLKTPMQDAVKPPVRLQICESETAPTMPNSKLAVSGSSKLCFEQQDFQLWSELQGWKQVTGCPRRFGRVPIVIVFVGQVKQGLGLLFGRPRLCWDPGSLVRLIWYLLWCSSGLYTLEGLWMQLLPTTTGSSLCCRHSVSTGRRTAGTCFTEELQVN